MKVLYTTILTLAIVLSTFNSKGQTAHGPSAKYAFSTLDKHTIGLGYNFVKFKPGFLRPSHGYYLEYLPEFKAIGFSANVQYTFIGFKGGFETSFRSKNENDKAYFTFFPHLGFDLINLDLSFGPEFSSTKVETKSDAKSVGFRAHIKIHPKLFNKGG